jgi:Protein of unknown function (DUF1573)
MKKHMIYLKTTILVLLAGCLSFAFTIPNKPKKEKINGILWSETTHNFGDLKIGPDAKAVFIFKNKQKAAVKLKSVEPGCSCTVSSFTSDEVKKNKKGEISATYKTKDRPGYFKKFIKVTFEDGRTQELIITGNIIP